MFDEVNNDVRAAPEENKIGLPKRKNQGCVCPATPVSSPAKGQKLASLKQSALLNAGNETSA